MDLKQLVTLVLQVSIVCTVLGFGLKTTVHDLLYLTRRPGLLLRSLLAVFVIVPLVAVALLSLLDLRPAVRVALVALAISPLPPLLPGRESKAGGRQSYGLSLMAILAALSIAYVPLALTILSRFSERSLAIGPGPIARLVLISVLLPLVAGVVIRARAPALADRLAPPVGLLAKVLLSLGLVALLAGAWRAVWAAAGDGTIVAIAIFTAAGLFVGHLLGGPDPENAVVLALSSASRHPAIALSIASANFPEERFAGTILLFLLVSGAVGIPVSRLAPAADRWSRVAGLTGAVYPKCSAWIRLDVAARSVGRAVARAERVTKGRVQCLVMELGRVSESWWSVSSPAWWRRRRRSPLTSRVFRSTSASEST